MTIDFRLFDADNHYYEATDAFTRHLEPGARASGRCSGPRSTAGSACSWRARSTASSRTRRFDPVARPGALDDYFRGRRAGDDIRAAFGELEPISPAYREPAARLAVMDEQGIEGCFLFPTLGVGMEQPLVHDPEAAHRRVPLVQPVAARRLDASTTRTASSRPRTSRLLDPDRAVAELDWVLDQRREGHRHAGRAGAGAERLPLARATRCTTRSGPGSPRPASRRVPLGRERLRPLRGGVGREHGDGGVPPPARSRSSRSADRPIYDTVPR